jgi:hypothetical protein
MSEILTHLKPCHTLRMHEDADTSNFAVGIHCIYNAISHIFDHHSNDITKEKDIGDYYSVLILKAVHLLMSQGKVEKL